MFKINTRYYFEFNFNNEFYIFDVYSIKFISGKMDTFSLRISEIYDKAENDDNFNQLEFIRYIDKKYGFEHKEGAAILTATVNENNIKLLKY